MMADNRTMEEMLQAPTEGYGDAIVNQINSVKNELRSDILNQTNELRNMMANYFQMNTASSSGSGSLPSNIVPNPQADLKAITTQSGVTLVGPSVSPSLSKEVPEVTKDTVQPSTKTSNLQWPKLKIQLSPLLLQSLNRPYLTRQEPTNRSSMRKTIC
nr:reverse transcriptase domain-containing protein [Tanacetum cinerariifolium]